jgi:glycosyltransferase involved in cell wall biosynthesis
LIHSLAYIPESNRPPLKIVGNTINKEELAFLEGLAAREKVQVRFETMVSNESLIRYYNQAFLVAYSPVQEPFGLVPLEAMACGTPVVGVAEGGVCETILHGETGWLVERDPRKFAECIQNMLDQPDVASEMGRKGRDWVCQQWNWEKSNRILEELLAGVVSG